MRGSISERRGIEKLFLKNPSLFHDDFIRHTPGGIHNAEENKIGFANTLDPLNGLRGDINAVSRDDFAHLVSDMHPALPFQDVINFRGFKGMGLCLGAGLHDGVSKTIAISPTVGLSVENLTEMARIPRDDFFAVLEASYQHGFPRMKKEGSQSGRSVGFRVLCQKITNGSRLEHDPADMKIGNDLLFPNDLSLTFDQLFGTVK
jgi:hypothetical protein